MNIKIKELISKMLEYAMPGKMHREVNWYYAIAAIVVTLYVLIAIKYG